MKDVWKRQRDISECLERLATLLDYDDLNDLLSQNPLLEDVSGLIQHSRRKQNPIPSGPVRGEKLFTLSASVGYSERQRCGGKNRTGDVRKVMDKLYQLNMLGTADYYYEFLQTQYEAVEMPVHKIPKTVAAIRRFQRLIGIPPSGIVECGESNVTYRYLARLTDSESLEKVRHVTK